MMNAMNGWGPEVAHALIDEFEEVTWVDFVILFGSTARGMARPNSDYDLAVRVRPGQGPSSPMLSLMERCNRAVGAEKCHVFLFDQAPLLLKNKIFEEGRVLFERDSRQREHLQADTLRRVLEMPEDQLLAERYDLARRTDPEPLSRRLGALMHFRDQLSTFTMADETEFILSYDLHHLAERYLQLAAEAMLDVALHFVPRKPTDSGDVFTALAERGLTVAEFADRWRSWMEMRKYLLHRYMDFDHQYVYHFIADRIDDLDSFLEWAGQRL